MPAVTYYVDPNDKLRTNVWTIDNELNIRTDAFKKARKYYDGKHKPHLDIKDNEPDDNTVINVVKEAVDRTVTFLFPAMPKLELMPSETEETPDEEWLRDVWEANGGIALLHEIGLTGALSGHNFVRIMPPDGEDHDYPRIGILDPTQVTAYWYAPDKKKVVWYEVKWAIDKTDYVIDFINTKYMNASEADIVRSFMPVSEDNLVPELTQWMIVEYSKQSGQRWEIRAVDTWPAPFAPIVSWPHMPTPGAYYGTGECTHMELNDNINLIASQINRIIRYHASPKTVGTGIAAGKLDQVGEDTFWTTPNENAKIFNLEMKSDLGSTRDHLQYLKDEYLSQSRVVILKGDVKDFQRVTNAGVRTVFIDMLSKNIILRWLYGVGIQQISRRLMFVAGKPVLTPDVVHADPLPVDSVEEVNNYAIERNMGVVSRQTVSSKRGYNWTDEYQKMQQEQSSGLFSEQQPTDNVDIQQNQGNMR